LLVQVTLAKPQLKLYSVRKIGLQKQQTSI